MSSHGQKMVRCNLPKQNVDEMRFGIGCLQFLSVAYSDAPSLFGYSGPLLYSWFTSGSLWNAFITELKPSPAIN